MYLNTCVYLNTYIIIERHLEYNEMLKVLGKKTVFQQDTVLTNMNYLTKICLEKR